MRQRLVVIGCLSALMLAAVLVVGESLRAGRSEAILSGDAFPQTPSIESESGMFKRMRQAQTYDKAPEKEYGRTVRQFYARRAYPGAPPMIPHEVLDEQSPGGASCLSCHADGGYTPRFQAYAPVTPHPELSSCKQCHVAGDVKSKTPLFVASTFQALAPPALDGEALPGAPPPVPHGLDMRNNCVACHAGPGAVKELRTPHAARANCRQCHVQNDGAEDSPWAP